MRIVRNVSFAVLLLAFVAAYHAPVRACEDWFYLYGGDCYPESSGDFDTAAEIWCWSECADLGGITRLNVFSTSNPCEAFCFCTTPSAQSQCMSAKASALTQRVCDSAL